MTTVSTEYQNSRPHHHRRNEPRNKWLYFLCIWFHILWVLFRPTKGGRGVNTKAFDYERTASLGFFIRAGKSEKEELGGTGDVANLMSHWPTILYLRRTLAEHLWPCVCVCGVCVHVSVTQVKSTAKTHFVVQSHCKRILLQDTRVLLLLWVIELFHYYYNNDQCQWSLCELSWAELSCTVSHAAEGI